MLEKSENKMGLLLNLPAEINIYFQEQTAKIYLHVIILYNAIVVQIYYLFMVSKI